ncbi:MAG: SsrA-binding protein, partial [Erysipelotrichaceae bacterium]
MSKLVVKNRKAAHEYFLEESFEAGMVLVGTEIKAIRKG